MFCDGVLKGRRRRFDQGEDDVAQSATIGGGPVAPQKGAGRFATMFRRSETMRGYALLSPDRKSVV